MKHILFTLKECSVELLDDEEFIRKLLYRTTKECKATLLHLAVHKFDPQGVTGFAMLAESHISIHTWPEKGMAVCDVFTCGENNLPDAISEYMYERMEATGWVGTQIKRELDDE